MIMTLQDAEERYGKIENGVWKLGSRFCSMLEVPEEIEWTNSATSLRAARIYCNKDMQGALARALQSAVDQQIEDQFKTFDGCFMVRDVRGIPGQLSCHAYALAIDINSKSNPLGGAPTLSRELVKCFTDQGFVWGGNFHRCDGMHFSFGWE